MTTNTREFSPVNGGTVLISDGFGSAWQKCNRPSCDLHVVRPGKAQCSYCPPAAVNPVTPLLEAIYQIVDEMEEMWPTEFADPTVWQSWYETLLRGLDEAAKTEEPL